MLFLHRFICSFSTSSTRSFHDDPQSLLAFKKLITSDPHSSVANWSPPLPAAAVIQTEWLYSAIRWPISKVNRWLRLSAVRWTERTFFDKDGSFGLRELYLEHKSIRRKYPRSTQQLQKFGFIGAGFQHPIPWEMGLVT